MKKYLLLLLLFFGIGKTNAQTVGVISNSPNSFAGYTLFSPNSSTSAYLIDNCGYLVKEWSTSTRPGVSAYLLEDGSLLRTGKTSNPLFNQGGVGGKVQRFDWNDNLIWDYTFSTNTYCQHHDIEYLPNGNVLILATEVKSQAECIAEGRDSTQLIEGQLWPEFIVEVRPIGIDSGEIVWEWHSWDHLVQNHDSTKANYQPTVSYPGLFNVNYNNNGGRADWMHVNSIDYNPDLDQIVLSSKDWSELWIIDHSTTTAEAASDLGGNSGKGGNLIYRWGNPSTYNGAGSRVLEDQHDVHWIEASNPDSGKIMIFNNGRTRGWSSVDIIAPPVDVFGNYQFANNNYGPSNLHWTYVDTIAPIFYAFRISGAHQLPNGNVQICAGTSGYFFEVDSMKNTVWEYINPILNSGIATQGQIPGLLQNTVFRAYRYGEDYAGFNGQNLMPTLPIELNYNTNHCNLYTDVSETEITKEPLFKVYPNPVINDLTLEVENELIGQLYYWYNSFGQLLYQGTIEGTQTTIKTKGLEQGAYILSIGNVHFERIILR
jgi:hypothetical protein